MGFKVRIEGADIIDLKVASITQVEFKSDTPDAANARSTDLGATLKICGKILASADGGNADDTMKMAAWSTVPAEKADCYRKVTVEVIAADQVVRKINFPDAFVVDYNEYYDDAKGTGAFELITKQKKDNLPEIKIEGGYNA